MPRLIPSRALSLAFAVGMVACAKGNGELSGVGGAGGDDGAGSGLQTTGSTSSTGSFSSSTGSGLSSSSSTGGVGSGGGESSGTSSTGGSSSGEGAGGSSSSSGSGGGSCSYTATDACGSSIEIPSIAGDDGSDMRVVTGQTSAWYKLYVEETVSDIFDYPSLSFSADLQSPAGVSYGLFIYPGDDSSPSCSGGTPGSGTPPSSYYADWGDNPGSDDSTWFTLEVRYLSGGACGADAQWTLTIQGDD